MKIIDIPRSGSFGSITSSHNRAGQYVRNRRSPTQPVGTGRRSQVRSNFSAASQAWSGLTDAQRAAWATFADGYPITDRLGQSIKLTGHQFFVRCAAQLLNCEVGLPTDPPVSTVVPVLSSVVPTLTAGTPAFNVAFISTGDGTDFILVACSGQMSAGRMFNKTFWQATYASGDDTTVNILAKFNAQFGELVAGRRVFVKLTPVNQYGLAGAPTIVSAIVGA